MSFLTVVKRRSVVDKDIQKLEQSSSSRRKMKYMLTDTIIHGGQWKESLDTVISDQNSQHWVELYECRRAEGLEKRFFREMGEREYNCKTGKEWCSETEKEEDNSDVCSSRKRRLETRCWSLSGTLVCSVGAVQLFLVRLVVRRKIWLLPRTDCFALRRMERTLKWGGCTHARL